MRHDTEMVAAVYAATFAARWDAYAAWNGEHWTAVREELSAGVIIRAFTQGPLLSGYTIGADGRTHVMALDFDTDDGLETARVVAAAMWANGMYGYVEPSRRGAHVWCIADRRLPAITMRRALRMSLAWAGVEENPKIEFRPISDAVSVDGLGSPLRMPTMPHPATGKRYPLCHPDGTALPLNLGRLLLEFDQTPAGAIELASTQYVPPARIEYVPAGDRAIRSRREDDDASASEILMTLWNVPFARPGRSIRCPAHDDRQPSLSILADDKRVVCHAPACELHNDGHGRGTYELRSLATGRAHDGRSKEPTNVAVGGDGLRA